MIGTVLAGNALEKKYTQEEDALSISTSPYF